MPTSKELIDAGRAVKGVVVYQQPTGSALDRHRTSQDRCPACLGGELDTGWECQNCGYDAQWLADQ